MKLFQYLNIAEVPPATHSGTPNWKEQTSPDRYLPNEVPAALVRRTGLSLRRQNVFALTAAVAVCAFVPPASHAGTNSWKEQTSPDRYVQPESPAVLQRRTALAQQRQGHVKLIAAVTAVAFVPVVPSVVSINFVGTGATMGSSEAAGVVNRTNWNQCTTAAGTLASLVDENAKTTAASVTWHADGIWALRILDTPGNIRMMEGYLDDPSGGATTVTLTGLSNNCYDIYVYTDGDNGTATRSCTIQISGSGISTSSINVIDSADPDVNATFSGRFTEARNTTGNYVVFSTNSVTGFTITATALATSDGTLRASLNSLQIVPRSVGSRYIPTGWNIDYPTPVRPRPSQAYLLPNGPDAISFAPSTPVVDIDSWVQPLATPVPSQKTRVYSYPILSEYVPLTTPAISVRFKGNSSFDIGPTEVAGVVPKAIWLNALHAVNSYSSLPDENGNLTSAALSFTADSVWAETIADAPGNVRMMEGYLEDSFGTSPTATFTGLPPGTYDVYVYAQGATSPTRAGSYQVSGTGIPTTAKIITDLGGTQFDGTFTEASNSAGNYCVFTVTTVGDITITATPTTADDGVFRCPLNAIQLIPKQVGSTYVQPTGWQPDVAASRPLYRRQPLPVGDASFFVPINIPDADSWLAPLSQPVFRAKPLRVGEAAFFTAINVPDLDSWVPWLSQPQFKTKPLRVGEAAFFTAINVPDLDSWIAQLPQPLRSLRPSPVDFQSFVPVTTPIVNVDSWAVELSVPVRPAKRLTYAFPASHEFVAVNIPDSDSWTPQIAQPLFKGKPLPVGDPAFFVAINVPDLDSWVAQLSIPVFHQSSLRVGDAAFFVAINVPDLDSWAPQLSTPVFHQPSLRVGDVAFFVAINVPDLDSWVSPLPIPVPPPKRQAHTYPASLDVANTAPENVSADRWAPELARPVFRAKAQPHTYPYAFDVSIQTAPVFVDKWIPALEVPVLPRRRTIGQDSAFVAINVPDLDSWVPPLSQPVYRAAPLRVGEAAFFVPVNVPDLDSWVQQLSTPAYPQKRAVAEGAFVPVVAVTLSFVPNDAQPLVLQRRPIPEISSLAPIPQNLSFLPNDVQPIRATRGTVREQYAFVQVVAPSVDSWATELNIPTYLGRRQPHTYPTTFEVSAQTAPVFIDKWSVELPRPVFDLRRSQYSFSFVADVPNISKELVSADRWTNPLSVPIFPQKRIITEGSAFVTFIPAPAVDPDKYAPELSRPTWYPKRTQYTYPCAFDVPNPAPERTSPDRWAFELGRPTWYPRRFQHTYPSTAFDVANTARERTTVDKWSQELSVPVPLRKRVVAEASFFTPVNIPRLDSWATQLSTPVFRTRFVAQHDASALVPINVPDLDSWATQLSTPVFRTRLVAQHDASALVTNIVSLSFLPNDVQLRRVVGQGYLSTVSDPVQVLQNLSFLPSDVLPRQKSNGVVPEISAFVPTVARKVTVDSWAVDLCVPTPIAKGRTHGYPSSFEVPSTLANFVPIDRWASGLSVPIFQQKRTIVGGEVSAPITAQSTAPFSFLPNYVQPTPRQVRAATSQTFDVVSTSSENVSVDRWVSQLSTPIFPQKIVVVETSFFIQTAAIPPVPGLSFLPNDIQVIRPPFNGYFLPFVSEHIFIGQTIVSGPLILLDPINGYPRNNSAINGRTRVNSVVDGIPRINAAIDGTVRTNEVVDGAPRINSLLPSPQPKDI